MDDPQPAKGPEPQPPSAPKRDGRARRRRRRPRDRTGVAALDGAVGAAPDAAADVANALDALRRTALRLARARGLEREVDGLELHVRLNASRSRSELAADFLGALHKRLDDAQLEAHGIPEGRAYCFRCDSFLCAHAKPADLRAVFAGYEPTGRPIWSDLLALLFDRRDPRAADLADRTGVIAIADEGARLTADRIDAFGGDAPKVEILSQVVAGPFPLRTREAPAEEAAITVQWLRVSSDGRTRLVLQPIGDPRLLDAASAEGDHDVQRILIAARAALRTRPARTEPPRAGSPADVAMRAFTSSLAHDLARDLQHFSKIRGRRTRHAAERAEDRERPTSHAFPEARVAADASIRVDQQTGTFVLLGKNARVHFFNADGRHVSSVRFGGEQIQARLAAGRWREALPAEIAAFRARMNG